MPNLQSPSEGASRPLLEIRGLVTEFKTEAGIVRAVDDVSLHIHRGETLCIVGESGSGKSVTALNIMRLVRAPAGRIVAGQIFYEGNDLLQLSEMQMMKIRGKEIAMIFQDPMSSLNPVMTVGRQIGEILQLHEGLNKREARERAIEMLRVVHIPSPEKRVDDYPHLMSGGMRQRIMIAMALCCKPKLLIADEPTTALDGTIQAQLRALLEELKEQYDMSILIITHDMGVVAEVAQRVAVMYGARVVEEAPVERLFAEPLHPYTRGLLRSIPKTNIVNGIKTRLEQIPGSVPSLRMPIAAGCRFAPRCKNVKPQICAQNPPLKSVDAARKVACFLHD